MEGVSEPGRPAAAGAGVLAAAAALGAGELFAGLTGRVPPPLVAVGDVVVDHAPLKLVENAIEIFGLRDKAALVTGVVVVCLALGAALGSASLRRWWVGPAGIAAAGVLGVLAASRQADASMPLVAAATAASVVVGIGVLAGLLRLGRPPEGDAPAEPARRRFLGAAVATGGLAAVAGVGGRRLRDRLGVEGARSDVALPTPARPAAAVGTGALDVPGLSPLVTPNDRFYRIDTALITPQVDPDDWSLKVHGRVEHPFEIGFDELLEMPMVERWVTLACVSNEVGGGLVGNARWLGVPLADLLRRARPEPGADQLVGRSVDGFTAGFPTGAARDGRAALVAVGMNGEPLPVRHGFPARLVVAGLYGYVSATKWLSEIELTRFEDFDAYWVRRGWAREAPVKTQSRIDTPRRGRRLVPGLVPVAGVAWAPGKGIERVEVRVDAGPWTEAELSGAAPGTMWRQWLYRWDATPGPHTLRCRATDGEGVTQTGDFALPFPDGATGWHRVDVTVTAT